MTNEFMIALPLVQWYQLSPLVKLVYSQKCACAALFWMSCLGGRYDICDSKSRRAQAALVRPHFDRWAQTIACGADKATINKMWDALVSDVRNCAGIMKGRELGCIDDSTYQKIGDGAIGRAEIAKIAIAVSKEQQRVEAIATDNAVVDCVAGRSEAGEVEGGVDESSREVGGTAMPTARAAAMSCGYIDDLKSKAAEMGLSAGKMARVAINQQRSALMDVCEKFGTAKQSRRLDAAAELAKRKMHPRAERIQGGGPSDDEESDDDDEEDESHVFVGMDGTSMVAAVRTSEVIGQVAALASSTANAGYYRQNEECERGRRRRRENRVRRIRGRGDGGEDGEVGSEGGEVGGDFEPEVEGEVTFQVGYEIQSGATTQRRGAYGFEKPCSINEGKGVYDIEAFCEAVESGRRHLSKDFVRYYLYNFGRMLWDLAGVGHLYGDSKDTITHLAAQGVGQRILEHQDPADISPQLIMTMGDFDGGVLEVLVGGRWVSVDTRYRPTLVEGRYWHRVTRITRGRRYVIIVFKNTDRKRDEAYPYLSSGYLK